MGGPPQTRIAQQRKVTGLNHLHHQRFELGSREPVVVIHAHNFFQVARRLQDSPVAPCFV